MERIKQLLSKSSAGILLVLVALVLFFQLSNPIFLTPLNIATMLRAMSYPGIIAIGMGVCLISGVIDLSVGAVSAFASVVFGAMLMNYHVPLIPAILITMAISAVFGLFNAFVIIKMGVPPFITTISSMFMIRGLALAYNRGFLIYPLTEDVAKLGTLHPLGVSIAFIVFLVVAFVAWYTLQFTVFGLEIRATGSDYEVAKVTEVRYVLVHVVLLMTTSVLASISGILLSFILNAGAPNIGIGWEFAAITACAIGGVSLSGYEGSIFGIICGLLVVQVLQNGIVMIGVSAFFQDVVVGAALLVAIIIDVRRRKTLNLESI